MKPLLLLVPLGLWAMACSSSDRSSFEPPADAAPPPVGSLGDGGGGDASDFAGDCAEENKQIYVLTEHHRAFYRFDPPSLQFTYIGDLNCPSSADTYSMAVDRKGVAWVELQDGHLFNVSTKDATCTEVPFKVGQTGFQNFGMGFSKDDAGGSETLFVAGLGLGKIDTTTYDLTFVGQTSGLGQAELTGTGDGLLYAFAVSSGKVVKLDKTNGAAVQTYRTSAVDVNAAWAFAHWGGDFWLFTGQTTSSVTHYSPMTDTSTVVVQDTGMLIVGAGSSTCAPVAPPR